MGKAQCVIGLVGQVCAGKSAVAAAFERHGARVFDADKYVAELYSRPDVIEEVRALFGESAVGPDNKVDRRALAAIVFTDPSRLKLLTRGVIYPRTVKAMDDAIRSLRESDALALVLDAPTLFEAGRDNMCDRIVYVAAPLERRKEWSRQRGWDEQEVERRQARLMDDGKKRQRANAVIDNAGSLEDLDRRVKQILDEWLGAGQCAPATGRSEAQ